jgi:Gram-negative bacterial TonB protein C-terminal
MNIRLKVILTLLCLSSSVGLTQVGTNTGVADDARPIILSPTLPKDSRGEIVYEIQGSTQKDQPVVPGVFVRASPIRTPQAKYPKSLKRARVEADTKVKGVVTQSGEVIDVSFPDQPDTEIAKSVFDAIKQYKFKPSTLDGKPIAILVQFEFHFRIR